MRISKQAALKNFLPIITAAIWATFFNDKLNNYVIGIFALYCLIVGWPSPRKISKADIPLFLPALIFLAYTVGFFWSTDFAYGWKQFDKRIPLAGFPLMFFFVKHKLTQSDTTRMLYAFVAVCLAISLTCYGIALWNVIENGGLKVTGTERNYYYFSYIYLTNPVGFNPIYLSLYINFAIVILLFKPLKSRVVTYSLIVYLIFFNVLVASKAGILVLAIVLFIYLLSFIKNKIYAVGICLLVFIVLIVTVRSSKFLSDRFLVSTEFNYELPWAGDWNSTSQRLAIWSCAIETIEQVFPLGYGTGNGQNALVETYHKKNYVRGYEDDYNAHNEFLYTLLDLGVLGLLVLLLATLWPFFRAIKQGNIIFVYFMILQFGYFFVEVVLTRRSGIVFFSFFYCLLTVNFFLPKVRLEDPAENVI